MPTQWSGQAELDAASDLGGKARQTDTQPTATFIGYLETATGLRLTDTQPAVKMSANGSASVVGYAATLFSALVNVLEQQPDAAAQRDAISALLCYHSAVKAESIQDRASLAHTWARHAKDVNLMLDYLLGKFGPAGLPLDNPSKDALAEIEAVVGAKRAASNLDPLPGTSYAV